MQLDSLYVPFHFPLTSIVTTRLADSSRTAFALAALLAVVLVLVIVFFFGTNVLIRAARRHRAMLDRERARSSCEDIWAMHRPPTDDDGDDDPDHDVDNNGHCDEPDP